MDIQTILVITHIIGTVIGVGGATFAEIFFLKAIKDGEIDPVEKSFLGTTYTTLRVGMFIVVVSGFLLVFYHYFFLGNDWVVTSGKIWAKNTLVVMILLNAYLIGKRMIPMWLGAAISFTSWYAAMILGAWRNINAGYVEIMLGYIVAVLFVAVILEGIKRIYLKM